MKQLLNDIDGDMKRVAQEFDHAETISIIARILNKM